MVFPRKSSRCGQEPTDQGTTEPCESSSPQGFLVVTQTALSCPTLHSQPLPVSINARSDSLNTAELNEEVKENRNEERGQKKFQ